MATDIGSLAAAELDGHLIRLGIGRKALQKHGEIVTIFLGALTLPL
jgi:hypothetical protein